MITQPRPPVQALPPTRTIHSHIKCALMVLLSVLATSSMVSSLFPPFYPHISNLAGASVTLLRRGHTPSTKGTMIQFVSVPWPRFLCCTGLLFYPHSPLVWFPRCQPLGSLTPLRVDVEPPKPPKRCIRASDVSQVSPVPIRAMNWDAVPSLGPTSSLHRSFHRQSWCATHPSQKFPKAASRPT